MRVCDVESLYDFFCVTFRDRDSDEKHHFRIWKGINQTEELREFLMTACSGLVGFNIVSYDWPMLNYIVIAHRKLNSASGEEAGRLIHAHSQRIIGQKYSAIRNPMVHLLDLFKMHHFDNIHKAVSLKALQIAMNWPLVADMPVDHTEFALGSEWAAKVEEYNTNDVDSTKYFLQLSDRDLTLRKAVGELYGMDFLNHNEAKMGEDIMLLKVAEQMGVGAWELRKGSTKRDSVALRDVIVPLDVVCKEFKGAVAAFEAKVMDTRIRESWEEEKEAEEEEDLYSCIYDGVLYDFGIGGLHGLRGKRSVKPVGGSGVYREDEENIILSADVSSYYINLAIRNGFAPEHLKAGFAIAYEGMYKERKKYPKGSLEDKGLKIGLVAVTGKSYSRWSPLYDPKYFFSIMINGQLQLAHLCELLTVEGHGKVIMANTDGVEALIPRRYEEAARGACARWAAKTGLTLEYKYYRNLFIRDVNNYVGEMRDGKTYLKGAYEHEDLKWEKDHSMLCVPKAAEAYLVKGIPIMQSLEASPVESFFIGKRAKSGGKFEIRYVNNGMGPEQETSGPIRVEQLSKTVRYLVTKTGGYLMKKEESAKKASQIDAPWRVANMMDIRKVDLEDLRPLIDYRFYEIEVKRLLDPILHTQSNFL